MEFVQMTLNDWVEIKQKLRQELLGVKQSFVRIGYMLRQIDDQKGYEQDGYKSIAEFAQKELGLHPSTTTRFMEINQEYSIGGYSERLREEYSNLGRSQLEEMLKLPDGDRKMIQPETPRESIRELKRFNSAEPAAGADDFTELLIKFYKDNPDALNEIFASESADMDPVYINRVKEAINPSGNRSYKMGLYFLMFYENKISVKQFGSNPQNMMWEEFIQKTWDIFGDVAAGPETWKNYFGGGEDEDAGSGTTAEDGEREKNSQKPDERAKTGEITERIGEKTTGEEIAPAQKPSEILEKEAGNDAQENPETERSMSAPEVIEKPFGSRKDYMDTLTVYGMANYLAEEYKRHNLKASSLAFPSELEKWLQEEVDENGMALEE